MLQCWSVKTEVETEDYISSAGTTEDGSERGLASAYVLRTYTKSFLYFRRRSEVQERSKAGEQSEVQIRI